MGDIQPDDGLKEATRTEESEGKFWADQIKAANKNERDWRKDADRVQERYRNEKSRQGYRQTTFPIFWSNVQVLKPNVYSSLPRPDVRRRAVHEDDARKALGKQAAIVVENGLKFEIDNAAFGQAMEAARDDMLIVGRGVVREVYAADTVRRPVERLDPMLEGETQQVGKKAASYTNEHTDHDTRCHHCAHFRAPDGCSLVKGEISPQGHCRLFMPGTFALDGRPVEPDGFDDDGVPYVDVVESERTESRYVFWADYRQSPARCWSEVWWVAFRHAMDRDELEREFPEHDAKKIPLVLSANTDKDQGPGKVDEMPPDPESPFGRAEVWEIWSKPTKERIWIATSYEDHVLRKDPDPLRQSGFFPNPKPLYAVPTTDSMVPMPELQVYECLADELDEVQDRLRKLVKVAKFVGLTDGDLAEMSNIATMTDGDFKPIQRPDVVAGDLRNAIWHWPLGEIVTAISILRVQSQELRDSIYELTGISDLRRGIGQERESATAQRLKASYGAARMTPRSKPMAEFIRDLLRIKAEIMVEHFEPATLSLISGAPIAGPVLQLLKDERFRNTTIDVETDSTVAPDAEAEKAEAVEYLTAATQYLSAAVPIATGAPATIPLLMSMLRAASRSYKFSREVEEQLDALAAQLSAPQTQPGAPGGMLGLPAPPPGGNGAAQPGAYQ